MFAVTCILRINGHHEQKPKSSLRLCGKSPPPGVRCKEGRARMLAADIKGAVLAWLVLAWGTGSNCTFVGLPCRFKLPSPFLDTCC
jgi:hypothetical protein